MWGFVCWFVEVLVFELGVGVGRSVKSLAVGFRGVRFVGEGVICVKNCGLGSDRDEWCGRWSSIIVMRNACIKIM